MKVLVALIGILLLHSCNTKSQKDTKEEAVMSTQQPTDSLVLKKYAGGDPFMDRINTEISLAKQWGFIIQYTFGDCEGTYDHLIKEFETLNKTTKITLENKFGENWEIIFQNQVTFNLHPWYLNLENVDDFIKSDTLLLSTKKNKATLQFNPDKKYTLTFETNNSKELIESYYDVSGNQLHLNFPNGNKQVYNYSTVQYEINLIRSN